MALTPLSLNLSIEHWSIASQDIHHLDATSCIGSSDIVTYLVNILSSKEGDHIFKDQNGLDGKVEISYKYGMICNIFVVPLHLKELSW